MMDPSSRGNGKTTIKSMALSLGLMVVSTQGSLRAAK